MPTTPLAIFVLLESGATLPEQRQPPLATNVLVASIHRLTVSQSSVGATIALLANTASKQGTNSRPSVKIVIQTKRVMS